MKYRPDDSTCVYGAGILVRQIGAIRQEMDGVRASEDIEYIHRMRVASRRLRTALGLFPGCLSGRKHTTWTEDIRRITRALGAARDTDVQIDLLTKTVGELEPRQRPGMQRLVFRLSQKRLGLQSKVIKALDRLEKDQVLNKMEASLTPLASRQGDTFLYSPALYQVAADSILDQLEEMLNFEEIIYHPEAVEQLHAMRIAAKHLRYTMEAFAAIYPDELKTYLSNMRKLQDSLGDIHDCDVWSQFLPAFIEQERVLAMEYYGSTRPVSRLLPGLHYFQASRLAMRSATYEDFIRDWKKIQQKGLWNNLRQTVEAPLYPSMPATSTEPEFAE